MVIGEERSASASITVLGSGKEVGRAAIALSIKGKTLLLDYGVNFDEEDKPRIPLHIRPRDIEAIIATHAHLDHIGAIPVFYISSSPKAFMTPLTRIISEIMLEDFLKISGYYLLFEHNEVKKLLELTTSIDYNKPVELNNFVFQLINAGHIPGSSSVLVDIGDKKILYTGDINTIETKLVKPANFSNIEANVLVMEATYGASTHPSRRKVEERFIQGIEEVTDKGGVVLVPAFSVGRGQEIMMVLAEHDLGLPVYVDGMIRTITEYMMSYPRYLNNPELLKKASSEFYFVRGWRDRRKIWKEPGVIIASAGMLKGGPALYYLKRIYSEEKNAVFLVSFQAPGTPGRTLIEQGMLEAMDGPLKARLEWFDFSSHADKDGLLTIASSIRGLEKIILVHGEEESLFHLARELEEQLDGVDVIIASNGETIRL